MAEYIIETKDNRWEVICGLEIHCQIISKSKMFSGASTVFGADANEHVSFVAYEYHDESIYQSGRPGDQGVCKNANQHRRRDRLYA